MRLVSLIFIALLVIAPAAGSLVTPVKAQQSDSSKIRNVQPPMPLDQLIQRFAAKETEFAQARIQYTYMQQVRIDEIGLGNTVTGEFFRQSEIVFDDTVRRLEKILRFPPASLQSLIITTEDLAGFGVIQPFSLTTKEIADYQIKYLGKEKIDELDTYVFDVTPKFMLPLEEKTRRGKGISKKEAGIEGRSFEGRVWVDDQDLMVVKTAGKQVPEAEDGQRFPHFESYRENIDGRYWFPTLVFGDDTLSFPKSGSVRLKFEVKYANYRKYSGNITLEDEPPPVKKPEKKP